MDRVKGKVAIVTGGGGGIGSRVAQLLAAEGAAVVVADADGARAEATERSIRQAGGAATAIEVDISIESDNERMVEAAIREYGRLDILHANAAQLDLAPQDHFVHDTSANTWDRVFATNARGTFLGCRSALPQMVKQRSGSIVATSSEASFVGHLSIVAYGCSKAAINTLMKYVATQYGRKGVRANAVAPGFTSHARSDGAPSEWRERYLNSSLTGRAGDPDDVAYCVLYLASDEAKHVTGQVVSVNGGSLSHMSEYAEFRALGKWLDRDLDL